MATETVTTIELTSKDNEAIDVIQAHLVNTMPVKTASKRLAISWAIQKAAEELRAAS